MLVLGLGAWVLLSGVLWQQSAAGPIAATSPEPAVSSTATSAPSPTQAAPQPAATCDPYGSVCTGSENGPFSTPYRAYLSGVFIPQTTVGGQSRATITLLNKGQAIGNLAVIFVTDPRSGYNNWWSHHRSITVAPGTTCRPDGSLPGFVCGPVAPGAGAALTMIGTATSQGQFQYAVKFADISGGKTSYIDEHADGAHDYVSWQEVVTS